MRVTSAEGKTNLLDITTSYLKVSHLLINIITCAANEFTFRYNKIDLKLIFNCMIIEIFGEKLHA